MKDYKRIADRNAYLDYLMAAKDTSELTDKEIEFFAKHNARVREKANAEIVRLTTENAALQKRLENAVELPCKVGDRIWVVIKNKHIFGRKVGCISILNYDIVFKLYNKTGWKCLESVYLKDYNKTWFTDRAEAEARLAELKGGNNDV